MELGEHFAKKSQGLLVPAALYPGPAVEGVLKADSVEASPHSIPESGWSVFGFALLCRSLAAGGGHTASHET